MSDNSAWVTDDDGASRRRCDGTPDQWLRCAAVLEQLPNLAGVRHGSDLPWRIRESVACLEKHGESDSYGWVVAHVCEEIPEPIVTDWFGADEDDWTPDQSAKIAAVRSLLTAYVRGEAPPPPETVALALSANGRFAQAASILGML